MAFVIWSSRPAVVSTLKSSQKRPVRWVIASDTGSLPRATSVPDRCSRIQVDAGTLPSGGTLRKVHRRGWTTEGLLKHGNWVAGIGEDESGYIDRST